MLYGITQCYLPPGRGDIPAFMVWYGMAWYGEVNVNLYSAIITKVSNALNTAEAGTRLSDPGGMQG